MLLTAIPNPNYMNGTMGVDSMPTVAPIRPYSLAGTIALDATSQARAASRNAVAVPGSVQQPAYADVYGTYDADGLGGHPGGYGGQAGTIALDQTPQAAAAAQNLPPRRMQGTLGLDAPAHLSHGIQSSPQNRYGMSGTIGLDAPAYMQGTIGLDAPAGMGTTGSLGVNLTAPYTRGGFRGELFDPAPMPTGYWRDAPYPVMLGTGAEPAVPKPSLFSSPIVQAAVAGLALYGLYRIYHK